jgi:hypothetical protein
MSGDISLLLQKKKPDGYDFMKNRQVQLASYQRLVLIWILVVSLVLGIPASGVSFWPQSNSPQETEVAIDSWVQDNYNSVLDLVFQDHCEASANIRWAACVRVIPGHQTELEYTLSVKKNYDGTILAHVTRAKRESVYSQLCKFKKEHPAATAGDIAKLIQVEFRSVNQQKFPALVHIADKFENIRFSPVLPDEIMMDPTIYDFHSRSSSGDQMDLIMSGPGTSAPRQPQPLIEWAESVRKILAAAFD